MVLQVNYRTDKGEILAAQAQDSGPTSTNPPVNQSDVRVLRTAAGLDLLIAAVIGDSDVTENRGNSIAVLREQIFLHCQESKEQDPTVILRDAVQAAVHAASKHPKLNHVELSILVAAISGHRLYLADYGSNHAYLVRGEHLISLTRKVQPVDQTLNLAKTIPVGISGRYSAVPVEKPRLRRGAILVDTNIHIPGEASRDSLDLQPGDGLILAVDRSIETVLRNGSAGHLPEDFLRLYDQQPPAVIADRLMQASGGINGSPQKSLIVIKTNENTAPFPIPAVVRGGSCLGQIGVIALILIISMVLGLAAAYAVPALMNPKPIANTGSNSPKPSGFISILMADGLAQANVPGQGQVILAPGAVLNASPGAVVETTRGTVKLQMIDGTNIYIGNNTNLLFEKLADPKVNLLDTRLVLSKGMILLDESHANNTLAVLAIPSPNTADINGKFIGVEYLPDVNQINIDCMEGACSLKTAGGSLALQTGQGVTVTSGVIGPVTPVDLSRYQSLCDAECPAASPQTLPTPTQLPTATPEPSAVPYLGYVFPTRGIPVTSLASDPGVAGSADNSALSAPSPTSTSTSPPVVNTTSPPAIKGSAPPKALRARKIPTAMALLMVMVMGKIRGAARIQKKGNHNSGVEY